MTQRATIENYAQAVRIVKEMNIDYHQWRENDWKEEERMEKFLICVLLR